MDNVPTLPPLRDIWIIPLSGQVQTDGQVAAKGDCIVTSGQAKITFSSDAKALVAF
jgi:hypothetical protein